MENEPVLSDRQRKRREAKAARAVPNAVNALYELLVPFDKDERQRLVLSVGVLLDTPLVMKGSGDGK